MPPAAQNMSVMHVGIPVMPACLYGPGEFKGVHAFVRALCDWGQMLCMNAAKEWSKAGGAPPPIPKGFGVPWKDMILGAKPTLFNCYCHIWEMSLSLWQDPFIFFGLTEIGLQSGQAKQGVPGTST